eukprot:s1134_g8.t1
MSALHSYFKRAEFVLMWRTLHAANAARLATEVVDLGTSWDLAGPQRFSTESAGIHQPRPVPAMGSQSSVPDDGEKKHVFISHDPLSLDELIKQVSDPSCGAITTFSGTTRDNFEGKKVVHLEYEAYEPMALKEMDRILQDVLDGKCGAGIRRVACAHRLGAVPADCAMSSTYNYAPVPVHLGDLIKSYDLTVPPWQKDQRVNLVTSKTMPNDYDITISMASPQVMDLQFVSFFKDVPTKFDAYESLIHLHMDKDKRPNVLFDEMYVHQALVKELDPLTLLLDQHSLFLPWNISDKIRAPGVHWCVEQFAGGFGGWAFGLDFLQRSGFPKYHVLSVEAELTYATQYTLSHACHMIGDPDKMPEQLLAHLNEDLMICGNIQDLHWQKLLQHVYASLWCISAPCKSWSFAGNQDGFSNSDGLSLAHAIAQCRIHQPKYAILEQVAGFESHMHFPMAMRLLTWAGYEPALMGVFDLASVTPCRRSRWLGVFVHRTCIPLHMQPQKWPSITTTIRQFDMILNLSNQECREFEPTIAQAAFYFDANFMPGITKVWTHKDILKYRIPSLDGKLPTFLHLYGQQHSLRPYRLTTMGLFGHFVRQGIAFRFYSPIEIMLGHCQADDMILLKPSIIGWETLGNAIAVPHAVFALAHALHQLHPNQVREDATSLVLRLIAFRLKASSSTMTTDEFAWYVSASSSTQHLMSRLHFFMQELQWPHREKNTWPPGTIFSPDDGLLPMKFYSPELTQELQPAEGVSTPKTQLDTPDHPNDFFHIVPLLIPGEYGTIQVHRDVTLLTLLRLWHYRIGPSFPVTEEDLLIPVGQLFPETHVMLVPLEPEIQDMIVQRACARPDPNKIVLHRCSTDLSLYEVEHAKTWRKVKQTFPALHTAQYELFGDLMDSTLFTRDTEIHDDIVPFRIHDLAQSILAALHDVKFEVVMPPKTDILILHCQGSPQARDAFLQFWCTEDHRRWCQQVGRQMNYQSIDDQTWRLFFRPLLPVPAMPLEIFIDVLFWNAARTIFMAMHSDEGIPVKIKMFGRTLCVVSLPAALACETILLALQHIRQLHPRRGNPSLMASAKRCGDICTIQDIIDRRTDQTTDPIIHVCMPVSGGGPNPTAKMEFHKLVQSDVANRFLQYGLDLPQVTEATSKLIEMIGLTRLHHLIHEEAQPEKEQSFRRLCESAGIPLPKHGPKMHLVAGKFQKLRSQRSLTATAKIDPTKYQLTEGFFVNADKTHTPILHQFSWQSTGVVLLSAEHALQIMTIANATVPDELAVYVPGDFAVPSKFHHFQTNAPAIDDMGRQVLLTGQLIQFGSRHVQTNVLADQIATKEVQVLAVTLWKEDFDAQTWDRIKTAPVKTAKDLLMLEGYGELMSKPWGRAYRAKGKPVPPEHAESVQFHAEFQRCARLNALLRISGFNRIYLTPKLSDGQVDPSWKVIWLPGTPQQIESLSAQIDGAAGLVRSAKSCGLRTEAGSFASAWARLKPDQNAPDVRPRKHVFRIQPLPIGTDKDILGQWAAQVQWDIRPLRSIGAKTWLIAADEPPPQLLCFNTQPLLVQKVTQKSASHSGDIVAGPRQLPAAKTDPKHAPPKTNVFFEGDPHMDPWAANKKESAEIKHTT